MCLVAALVGVFAGNASGVMLEAIAPGAPVTVGTMFDVDFRITDLTAGGAPSLGTYDFDVLFDPLLLSLDSVTFGTGLSVIFPSFQVFSQPTTDRVDLFEVSFDDATDLDTLQPSSFVLVTLGFTSIGVGTSPLTIAPPAGFSEPVFGDGLGASLLGVELSSTTVDVVAVPIPGATFLGAIGLVIVSARRRDRHADFEPER
jgi:hypothetical protein